MSDPVEPQTSSLRQRSRTGWLWWKEALIVAAFYLLYSIARNRFGSATIAEGEQPRQAFTNAVRVIDWERSLGIYVEEPMQQRFLGVRWFLQFWNVFYGTAHFAVTIGAFAWLFRRRSQVFTQRRNTLACTTALAIVGFSLFPLMPPRLMNAEGRYGGATLAAELGHGDFGYTDTIKEYGGPWKFDSGTGAKLSNQFAAMPSMHVGWATWSTLAMWPMTRRRWSRALLVIYPFATLFCIVVTGNHFVLDAVGGLLALGVGWWLGTTIDRWNDRRTRARNLHGESASPLWEH